MEGFKDILKDEDKTFFFIDIGLMDLLRKEKGASINLFVFIKYITFRLSIGVPVIYLFFGTGNKEKDSEDYGEHTQEKEFFWRWLTTRRCYDLLKQLRDFNIIHFWGLPLCKDNIDVNLANEFHGVLKRYKGSISRVVLVSGDGDFADPIKSAKEDKIDTVIIARQEGLSEKLEIADEIHLIDDFIDDTFLHKK